MRRASLAAALLLAHSTGCNAILGLDEVVPRGSGGGGGGSSVGGGGTGGGANCPDPAMETIIANGSFDDASVWTKTGSGDFVFDTVAAQDCALACGGSVGHIAVSAAADTSVGIYQDFLTRVDLGGTLVLNARYDHDAMNQPYFLLTSNGYDIGLTSFIKGAASGGAYVLDQYSQPVTDPRRTGNGGTLWFSQDLFEGQSAEDWIDCVSLTYTPPPGVEELQNGWFDFGTASWIVFNGATALATSPNGLCSPTAGQVTVAPNDYGEVRNITTDQTWPAGTRFVYGGAVTTVDVGAPLAYELFLRIEYDDATFEARNVDFASDSEAWLYATGEYVVPKTVTAIGLAVAVDNFDTMDPHDFLADCFSMRAIPP